MKLNTLPHAEVRSSKLEIRRKSELRTPKPGRPRDPNRRTRLADVRASIFGFRTSFGLRPSNFGLRPFLGARGFTLIELLLVLVILGVLAAIVVPKFSGRTEQAKVTAATTQIATFGTALDAFEVDSGSYPKGKDGLEDLITQPRDAENWKGPYLKGNEVPLDPWGSAYVYECPGKMNPNGYDLMSMGPDKREGGDDDITNWESSRRR